MNNYQKYGKKYYQENKEKFYAYRKTWLEKNPEKAKELQRKASQKYYAKKKQQHLDEIAVTIETNQITQEINDFVAASALQNRPLEELLEKGIVSEKIGEALVDNQIDKWATAKNIQYSA